MTKKSVSGWTKALFLALGGKSESERKKIISNLQKILKNQKKENLFPGIVRNAQRLLEKKEKIILTFGNDQNSEIKRKVEKKIFDIFGSGRKVEIFKDENIIGGFRLEADNFLIKASIKDFLDSLKEKVF